MRKYNEQYWNSEKWLQKQTQLHLKLSTLIPTLTSIVSLIWSSLIHYNWDWRGVCTEFSTLVEINRLNKLLTCSLRFLSDLEGLWALCNCCLFVYISFGLLLIEGLYRGWLVWPDFTLSIQLHLVHCITHSSYSLVLYGSLNLVFNCLVCV
jgi:hypothetical protein